MKVLGIETSCDETAAAVVEDGVFALSNVVTSQVDIHRRYGGVVPEVASRQHLLSIIPIVEQAMSDAGIAPQGLSAIAVTNGPGLAGSLLVGVNAAKALALAWDLPLAGINHLEAHIYANWLGAARPEFPLIALVVSGGHTDLVLMKSHDDLRALGRTRDDAAGEAFDKVARELNLGYPGGPAIEQASMQGNARFRLPRARLKGSYDFSFSGLKTAAVRLADKLGVLEGTAQDSVRQDMAASFQEAVVDMLVSKTMTAVEAHHTRCLLLAGGVAANSLLRETVKKLSPVPVLIPDIALCTDNAAMVASCGYFRFASGKRDGWDLDVLPGLTLG